MKCLLTPFCIALLSSSALAADPEEFSRLFDGKTFNGGDGKFEMFRIEDGAVVGGSLNQPIARNEFLCTEKAYSDFELRLKFKVFGKGVNGGVQIRSQRIRNQHEVSGYQADIEISEEYLGCLYDESRRNKVLAWPRVAAPDKVIRDRDWNDYVIRCEGQRIQLWVNGRQTVDYTEPDASLPQTGIIGLQIHAGPPSEVWYKNIRIKELSKKREA